MTRNLYELLISFRGVLAVTFIRTVFITICAALMLTGCAERSERFPSKPITIVVTWDAGGGTDALARSLALHSSDPFGAVVNVLNRPGGSGAVGHSFGATARPDGYTVTMITYELCTYKPLGRVDLTPQHFKPVMQLNEDPAALTVHADSPWQTLDDFIAAAKANPGEITIGNSGPGAVWHIGALKLESLAGAQFTHVPHNGAKPAVTQLLGKHIDAVSVSPAEVLQYLELGTLRCLGVMSEERFASLPDVPTLREQGVDLVHGTWRGLAVPPETPDEIVAELQNGFKQGFDAPEFQDSARTALLGLRYRDAAAFKEFLTREYESVSQLLSGENTLVEANAEVTPMTVPRFYMVLIVAFALVLAGQSLLKRRIEGPAPADSLKPVKPAAIAFGFILLYVILMFVLGYLASTLLFLALMFVYLGERRWARIGLWALSVTVIVFLIFSNLLDVPLPGFGG